MDQVICELCYKGTILQRNYRKMTIFWSFSYNSFVKLHGKKMLEPQYDTDICFFGPINNLSVKQGRVFLG